MCIASRFRHEDVTRGDEFSYLVFFLLFLIFEYSLELLIRNLFLSPQLMTMTCHWRTNKFFVPPSYFYVCLNP